MLSDKLPLAQPKKRRKKSDVRRWWGDSQKIEAVKLYMITGNLTATAAALDIPRDTLRKWKYSSWWGEVEKELKQQNSIVLSNKLKSIVDKALDITMDRLENGDFVYDQKKGELIRKPVVMRDAAQVANTLLEKRMRIEDKPVVEEQQQKINDRLLALAEAFKNMANKTRVVEVIDA